MDARLAQAQSAQTVLAQPLMAEPVAAGAHQAVLVNPVAVAVVSK